VSQKLDQQAADEILALYREIMPKPTPTTAKSRKKAAA